METAQHIRDAVAAVVRLREQADAQPALLRAVVQVKQLQSRRFAGTYSDLLAASDYATAARFFLQELYSDKDYAERDAQFSRIAGTIETLFPAPVGRMAATLAQLHALTEDLDQALASQWMLLQADQPDCAARYIAAWRSVGRREDRNSQLEVVLGVGQQLARLTRTPGLRTMLRMMRAPAAAAGMAALQRFLESGFDHFAALSRKRNGAEKFLEMIGEREAALINSLFDAPFVACETQLSRTLGQAR